MPIHRMSDPHGFEYYPSSSSSSSSFPSSTNQTKKTVKIPTVVYPIGIVAILFLVLSFCGFSVVGTGEAGMKVTFGDVTSKNPLPEGIYFYNPITTSLVTYDCKNRVYALKTQLYTKDNQPAEFAVSVTYHLNREKVIELHKSTGKEYEAKLFVKNVNGCLKDIVGQIPTDDIVVSRTRIADELKSEVTRILKDYGIEVVFVNIDEVDYSDAYEAAISEKQVALQKSQKEKNETARIAEAAKQQVLKAEAEAKSKLAIAEAEAKSIVLKAQAEAEGIAKKNDALANSPLLVDYTIACQWDGKMPQTLLGSGSNGGSGASPIYLFGPKATPTAPDGNIMLLNSPSK